MLEETGHITAELELLGRLAPDTGRLGNRLWCFYAAEAVPRSDNNYQPEPGVESVCFEGSLAELMADPNFFSALNYAALLLAVGAGTTASAMTISGDAASSRKCSAKKRADGDKWIATAGQIRRSVTPIPETRGQGASQQRTARGLHSDMVDPSKSYLVTGGTGFIGSALVRRGRNVAPACGLSTMIRGAQRRLADVASLVEFVVGDIRNPDVVTRAVSGVDCVCHLAYINGTESFYNQPDLVLDVGIRGMINVVDACRACGVTELVLASSSEVYQTPPTIPTDETVPLSIPNILNPRYSYGGGKVACELMAINFGRTGFDRVLIFRPHNVYGPDMGQEHVIPQFALRMSELCRETTGTIRFPIQGTGRESRAFIYIDDLIDGVLRVIDRGEHLGIYHIGTDIEVTIEELARQVARYFGRDLEIVPGELAPGARHGAARTSARCARSGSSRASPWPRDWP